MKSNINRCQYHGITKDWGKIVGSPIVRGNQCIQCLTRKQSRQVVPYEDFKKYQAKAAMQRVLLLEAKLSKDSQ